MPAAHTAVLKSGESLQLQSLVSPDGAYALQHCADGTLVFRDNLNVRDLWRVGPPSPAPGRFSLRPEGYLVLESRPGVHVWSSGGVDRRVVAAMVRDDGRLVLVDHDGYPRWSRDPLSAADLAAYRPASGDRLARGEILAESIVSPDGRYQLTYTPEGETVLGTPERRRVWSCKTGMPGAAIALGSDGVLRIGTDSTVLPRWTGRIRLDPMAFVISALIVRNDGDFILVGDDGTEIYNSQTAAEEARIHELNRTYARQQEEENAKPLRPAGSGVPGDWFDLLELSGPYTITLVQRVDGREALLRLGAGPETIRPMTYAELVSAAFPELEHAPVRCALAVPIDDWTMLIEPCGIEGTERIQQMSEQTQAVTYREGYDGQLRFYWYRNNQPLVTYEDDDSDLLDSGAPATEGAEPGIIIPFMEQIGLGRYRPDTAG